ncbi:MAG TPA: hypothetical protein VJ385_07500 [Fibrobacteria bacterium]|nr:hypothetical protein [Fibrobacteria bacterium]
MFILRESIGWLMATGAVGLYLGHLKGMARWGLLLGMIFGPIGWGLILLLPARHRPSQARAGFARGSFRSGGPSQRAGAPGSSDPVCPRCGNAAGRGERACGHCGNLLMPIRYRVTGPAGPTGPFAGP